MLILLNIGNTNTQIGYVERPGIITRIKHVPTTELSADIIPPGCEVAAATVVPGIKEKLADHQVFWVEEASRFNVNFDLVDLNTLGSDRIANAVALAEIKALPGLCIDCGTAVTFEMIDRNGIFKGGAIAPGRMLMNRALNDHTAQLPLIELSNTVSAKTGCNTNEAIELGIDFNMIGGIKEFISFADRELEGGVRVVAVGGDSWITVDNIDNVEYGGDDFTLRGIMTLWELNKR
jgi:type III pantothenate kinase